MILRAFLLVLAAAAATSGPAQAQQYRWVDKNGKVQFTDTPPPPGTRDVRKTNFTTKPAASAPMPFELVQLQKNFPVTLYSSPPCKEACEQARALLNKRGIPFTEVQVWDDASHEKLKNVAGSSEEVPVLTVGRSVQKGYQAAEYNDLLDSAGYPKTSVVPLRSQAAPPVPEGYAAPGATAVAKPVTGSTPGEAAPKTGPYDTSGLQGPAPKVGPYDPSGLTGPAVKPGPYGTPAESK